MRISREPKLILKAMQEHELVISRLYGVFAKNFPDFEKFWKDLAVEEIEHAKWLNELQTDEKLNTSGVIIDRFPMAAVEKSITFIKNLIQRFSDTKLPLIQALSQALYIEEALIENKYFEVFQSDSPAVQQTMNALQTETQKHFETIKKLWLKNK